MGHLLGYARVSTTDQQPQLQVDALKAAGCYRVFVETARQVIAVMRQRLAAGEQVARMYQQPGLAWSAKPRSWRIWSPSVRPRTAEVVMAPQRPLLCEGESGGSLAWADFDAALVTGHRDRLPMSVTVRC